MAIMLTGDRPTGPLHLGHYYGSLRERLRYQADPDVSTFVLLADAQAYTDHAKNPGQVHQNVLEVMLDYLAVGIDPEQTTIFVQSHVPEINDLSVYLQNLVTLNMVLDNPTVKSEIKQKQMGEGVPAGFAMYPVHQAADILIVKGEIVPVGSDQKPMIELAREIAWRFNRTYRPVFPPPREVVPDGGRLPGTDGRAKASKTLGNAIDLNASADEVAAKVQSMYTDPTKATVADAGTVEGHVPFAYLDAFDPDTDGVAALKEHYQAGGLGDVAIKRRLTEVLNDMLDPIRTDRAHYAQDPGEVMRMLEDGTTRTREIASQTISEAKQAMGLTYFD